MYVGIPGLKAEYLADGYNHRGVSKRKLGRADLAVADYTKAFELCRTIRGLSPTAGMRTPI